MIELLLLPFDFAFMNKAFLIVAIISCPTAILSCFLVLKGWSLMGDAISHAVFPGLVIAHLLNISLIVGAFCSGLFCAIFSGFLAENSRLKNNTAIGIVFSGMFGLGLVVYSKAGTGIHIDHILLGNLLGVDFRDLLLSGSISVSVFVVVVARYKDFFIQAFDPIQATVVGISNGLIHYSLLCMISLAVVSMHSSVGIILAIGLLIAPGATAFLLTKKIEKMLLIAFFGNLISGFLGIYISFFLDSAPAPTIILVLSIFFAGAFFWRLIDSYFGHAKQNQTFN